jgi:hypothetical protein
LERKELEFVAAMVEDTHTEPEMVSSGWRNGKSNYTTIQLPVANHTIFWVVGKPCTEDIVPGTDLPVQSVHPTRGDGLCYNSVVC